MRFSSQKDAWLVVLLLAVATVASWIFAQLMASEAGVMMKLLLGPVLLAAAGFLLWSLLGTDYRVTADTLLVRVGPLRWRVPLESVVEIAPDRNLLASAALSHVRLRIRVSGGPGEIYVAPRDRQGFLECMQAACAGLQREGDRWVRK